MPKLSKEKEILKKNAGIYQKYPGGIIRNTKNSNKKEVKLEKKRTTHRNVINLHTPEIIHEYQIYMKIKKQIIKEIKEYNSKWQFCEDTKFSTRGEFVESNFEGKKIYNI